VRAFENQGADKRPRQDCSHPARANFTVEFPNGVSIESEREITLDRDRTLDHRNQVMGQALSADATERRSQIAQHGLLDGLAMGTYCSLGVGVVANAAQP
jgi:hypothetical protein